MRYSFASAALLLLASCTLASPEGPAGTVEQHDTTQAGLTFAANFTQTPSAPLVAGREVRVAYDPARLTACRGNLPGGPGWGITGYYRTNGGTVGTFEAGGLSPSHGTTPPVIVLAAPGDLEIWFQNTSAWGCSAYDSNNGSNYHFAVAAAANAPGWVGNATAVTSRATCSGLPCDADFRPLDAGFTFDTWTRQRAAITSAFFEVWKQGVTDFDNVNLWSQLDVQLHARVGSQGSFRTSYVSFDRRTNHNARYVLPLRPLDPLAAPGALTSKAGCPTFPTTFSADGQYIQADLQFYFTVNGTELRPAGGGVFHGHYANYRGLYAICETP